jgi:DNA topoisomerase-2
MLLVNGCVGIGTGFSTDIPPYNPMDLVRVLKERLLRRLPSMKSVPLKPWWFGFTGEIVSGGEGTWITKGKYTLNDEKHTITITELPVGVWTKDYKAFLDEMAGAEKKDGKAVGNAFDDDGNVILKNFDDLYTDTLVKFVLYFTEDTYEDMKAHPADFEKRFRLTSSWKTTNMVAFNKDSKITRYESVGDILEGFYGHRLDKYEERRLAEIMRLEKDADIAENTAKFLKGFLEGRIDLRRCTDEQIVQMMKKEGIAPLSNADAAELIDAYDYVLRLRMDRVKQSAIDAQEAAVVSAQQALQTLRETTASQMWLRELDEFESAWGEYTKERMEAAKRVASSHGSTSGKKAIYKKKN